MIRHIEQILCYFLLHVQDSAYLTGFWVTLRLHLSVGPVLLLGSVMLSSGSSGMCSGVEGSLDAAGSLSDQLSSSSIIGWWAVVDFVGIK